MEKICKSQNLRGHCPYYTLGNDNHGVFTFIKVKKIYFLYFDKKS